MEPESSAQVCETAAVLAAEAHREVSKRGDANGDPGSSIREARRPLTPALPFYRRQDEAGVLSLDPLAPCFTQDEADAAGDAWGFNCGPAALCALLGLTPAELRPHLGDFERKRYTNPSLMFATLRRLWVRFRVAGAAGVSAPGPAWPRIGLVRIQWGGPWCQPGVPIPARYRQTHWVACLNGEFEVGRLVFDVNGCGWGRFDKWRDLLVPWLIQEAVPRGDGTWWPTHAVEVAL